MKRYILRFRKVDRDIFEQIKKGEKTIETRAATTRYKNIAAGDILVFVWDNSRLEKVVKKATTFKSVPEMLGRYDIKSIMPDLSTIEEALKQYKSFPGYEEKIKKFGIIALEL